MKKKGNSKQKQTIVKAKESCNSIITKAAKAITDHLTALGYYKDFDAYRRMQAVLKRIMKTDKLYELGFGTLMEGTIEWLKGFSFNKSHKLKSILFDELNADWDLDKLTGELYLPALTPGKNCKWPKGADYFQLTAHLTTCDLDDLLFESCYIKSELYPCNLKKINDNLFAFPVKEFLPRQAMILSLSVEFFAQDGQGIIDKFRSGCQDSFEIVGIQKADFTKDAVTT